MLEMKCPSCGAAGRVPNEKVNTRLVCKKCLRVFHVTPGGASVLGEPPAPKHEEHKPRPSREASQYEAVERFDEMAARLSQVKVPRIPPMTLGIIGGIVLLSGLGYWLFSRQSAETRTMEVGRAIIKSDMKPVIDFSTPDTVMDTIRWYNDVYRQYGDLKLALGGQEAGILAQPAGEPKAGEAQVKMIFSKAGVRFDGSIYHDALNPNPTLSSGSQVLEVPLFWVKDMWGNWLLDGTKTFSGGAPSR
jgi:hypothetical protein